MKGLHSMPRLIVGTVGALAIFAGVASAQCPGGSCSSGSCSPPPSTGVSVNVGTTPTQLYPVTSYSYGVGPATSMLGYDPFVGTTTYSVGPAFVDGPYMIISTPRSGRYIYRSRVRWRP